MQLLKLKNLSAILMITACVMVVFSCTKDDEEPDPEPTGCVTEDLTFDNWAGEFLTDNCATSGCHAQGTTSTFEMYNFETATAAVGFGRIVGAINRDQGFSAMPKGGEKLSDCDISKMEAWIADGAPEN